jgi:hypothetical protein
MIFIDPFSPLVFDTAPMAASLLSLKYLFSFSSIPDPDPLINSWSSMINI